MPTSETQKEKKSAWNIREKGTQTKTRGGVGTERCPHVVGVIYPRKKQGGGTAPHSGSTNRGDCLTNVHKNKRRNAGYCEWT